MEAIAFMNGNVPDASLREKREGMVVRMRSVLKYLGLVLNSEWKPSGTTSVFFSPML